MFGFCLCPAGHALQELKDVGDVPMRFLLLLIVFIAVMALVQSKRHGCKFGDDDWLTCVVGNTKKEFYSARPPDTRLVQAEAARASAM